MSRGSGIGSSSTIARCAESRKSFLLGIRDYFETLQPRMRGRGDTPVRQRSFPLQSLKKQQGFHISSSAQERLEWKGSRSQICLAMAGKMLLTALQGKGCKSLSMKADGVFGRNTVCSSMITPPIWITPTRNSPYLRLDSKMVELTKGSWQPMLDFRS